ncbi:MAG: hypothetical protein ABJA78_20045, partial [Ferruginibacter sp.]
MKLMLTISLCLLMINAFTQPIKVPDFADPAAKTFYQSYSDHLIKCIKAIREKNEAKVIALFKNPGEQLVEREK